MDQNLAKTIVFNTYFQKILQILQPSPPVEFKLRLHTTHPPDLWYGKSLWQYLLLYQKSSACVVRRRRFPFYHGTNQQINNHTSAYAQTTHLIFGTVIDIVRIFYRTQNQVGWLSKAKFQFNRGTYHTPRNSGPELKKKHGELKNFLGFFKIF